MSYARDGLIIGGMIAVAAGAWSLSAAVGWIVTGVFMISTAVAWSLYNDRGPAD